MENIWCKKNCFIAKWICGYFSILLKKTRMEFVNYTVKHWSQRWYTSLNESVKNCNHSFDSFFLLKENPKFLSLKKDIIMVVQCVKSLSFLWLLTIRNIISRNLTNKVIKLHFCIPKSHKTTNKKPQFAQIAHCFHRNIWFIFTKLFVPLRKNRHNQMPYDIYQNCER